MKTTYYLQNSKTGRFLRDLGPVTEVRIEEIEHAREFRSEKAAKDFMKDAGLTGYKIQSIRN